MGDDTSLNEIFFDHPESVRLYVATHFTEKGGPQVIPRSRFHGGWIAAIIGHNIDDKAAKTSLYLMLELREKLQDKKKETVLYGEDDEEELEDDVNLERFRGDLVDDFNNKTIRRRQLQPKDGSKATKRVCFLSFCTFAY